MCVCVYLENDSLDNEAVNNLSRRNLCVQAMESYSYKYGNLLGPFAMQLEIDSISLIPEVEEQKSPLFSRNAFPPSIIASVVVVALPANQVGSMSMLHRKVVYTYQHILILRWKSV